jgi:hypothetical protein
MEARVSKNHRCQRLPHLVSHCLVSFGEQLLSSDRWLAAIITYTPSTV